MIVAMTVSAGSLIILSLSSFVLFRNAWVYRVRVSMIWADWAGYESLVPYGEMLARFWVWDAAKFVRPALTRRAA